MKTRHHVLLELQTETQAQIDDLLAEGSEVVHAFEDESGSTVNLATQLKELTTALSFLEREFAKRRLRKLLH